jgi:hypothetical protein
MPLLPPTATPESLPSTPEPTATPEPLLSSQSLGWLVVVFVLALAAVGGLFLGNLLRDRVPPS